METHNVEWLVENIAGLQHQLKIANKLAYINTLININTQTLGADDDLGDALAEISESLGLKDPR